MNRKEVLEAARRCVCGEREQDYGRPENNFARIAALWEAYNGHKYKPEDVAIMMALLKIARIASGRKADNYVDLAGYAALAGELATDPDGPDGGRPDGGRPDGGRPDGPSGQKAQKTKALTADQIMQVREELADLWSLDEEEAAERTRELVGRLYEMIRDNNT